MQTSLDALMDAYLRIRSEGGAPDSRDELQLLVQDKQAQAELLEKRGDVQGGVAILGEAYTATKVAIEHLRGGETLVRTLHFETEADEYEYEIDRNDSLRMLVEILLKERIADNARLAGLVQDRVAAAETLRRGGEAQASTQQYIEAIASLEASTTELIRAIRSAGIYIPR